MWHVMYKGCSGFLEVTVQQKAGKLGKYPKETTQDELLDAVAKLLECGSCLHKELERLCERVVWFNSCVFGRLMNQAVSEDDFSSVQILSEDQQSKRLKISRSLCTTWLVFTDGSCEPTAECKTTIIGEVLVSPGGCAAAGFGDRVDDDLLVNRLDAGGLSSPNLP